MNDDAQPDDPAPDDPLAAIEASRLGAAQKTALRLLSEGHSYREAAREAGLRSTADLKRHAQRFGLVEAHNRARTALVAHEREMRTADLIESMRRVAGKGARELLRRLDEEPESIATRDLTVAVGVALDKVARFERWEDGDERGSPLDLGEILDALSDRGGTVKLAVAAQATVGPAGAGGDERCRHAAPDLFHRLGGGPTEAARAGDARTTDAVKRAIDVTPAPGIDCDNG